MKKRKKDKAPSSPPKRTNRIFIILTNCTLGSLSITFMPELAIPLTALFIATQASIAYLKEPPPVSEQELRGLASDLGTLYKSQRAVEETVRTLTGIIGDQQEALMRVAKK